MPKWNSDTNLQYDPETIPKQQFSIAVLLLAIVVVAFVLIAVRHLSPVVL